MRFAKVTECPSDTGCILNRGFTSGLLTLLALVHFFLDICRGNLDISVCIDFSSHRWPKFCIWNVPRTWSEICPAGRRPVRGGPRLPCSSLLLTGQVTSPPPPPPPAPSIGYHTYHCTGQGRYIFLILHKTVSDIGSEIVIKWWDLLQQCSWWSWKISIYYCCWLWRCWCSCWSWLTIWLFIWTRTGYSTTTDGRLILP